MNGVLIHTGKRVFGQTPHYQHMGVDRLCPLCSSGRTKIDTIKISSLPDQPGKCDSCGLVWPLRELSPYQAIFQDEQNEKSTDGDPG